MKQFFLADDLSGALDAAAAFHHAGRRVRVTWDLDAADAAGPDDVVAFTTETRNLSPARAADVVRFTLEHARREGARLLYKKIDSTLRGSVAAEIEAVLRVWPDVRILLCPANPAVGRTIRDGILLVRGVPVADTEFGRDPVMPVGTSDIRQMVGNLSDRVIVADASTDADLARAVAQVASAGGEWVGVGSGALARPVAGWLFLPPAASRVTIPRVPAGPCFFVCGSAHPGNLDQAAALREQRGVPLHELRVAEPGSVTEAVVADLRTKGGAGLVLQRQRGASADCLAAICSAAAAIIHASGARRIFATGGETTFGLCRVLGIRSLEFVAELEPGMSLSMGAGDDGRFAFGVKPGGFGGPHTWITAWDHLKRM